VARASTANLYRHTAAYTYIDRADGGEYVGSGTLVQIGDELFLATVAHTNAEVGSIALVRKAGLMSPEPVRCVIRRVADTRDEFDVGVFQVTTDAVTRVGLEPISLDRVHDAGWGDPIMQARLIGYPNEWILAAAPLPNLKRFHALAYGCETIEPTRWPSIPLRGRLRIEFDRDIHLVVHYTDDVVSYDDDKLPVPEGTPNPKGMSGGGLWQRRNATRDDEIWTASDSCLVGIQSDWLIDAGYLRSIQIIHWLKLVANHFPSLRRDLEKRFPRLKRL